MRRAARRDAGEQSIIQAMRACGAYVKAVNAEGTFDLLCYYNGRTLLLEIKDGTKPPSARRLTDAEQRFHDEWPGDNLHIINSVQEALDLLKACS